MPCQLPDSGFWRLTPHSSFSRTSLPIYSSTNPSCHISPTIVRPSHQRGHLWAPVDGAFTRLTRTKATQPQKWKALLCSVGHPEGEGMRARTATQGSWGQEFRHKPFPVQPQAKSWRNNVLAVISWRFLMQTHEEMSGLGAKTNLTFPLITCNWCPLWVPKGLAVSRPRTYWWIKTGLKPQSQ